MNQSTPRTCPLCKSARVAPYFDDDSRILRCLECENGFLSQELWIEDMEDYYHTSESYAANSWVPGRVERMRAAARDLLAIMSRYIRLSEGARLLDIGSNYGVFIEEANQRGFDAEGVEMNTELVQKAKSRGLSVIQGSASDLSAESVYQVITMIHVLEHVPDVRQVLKNIHRALKDGGHFFVEVHNMGSYIAREHKGSWKYVSLEHLFYFTPQTLSKLLVEEGFDVLDIVSRNQYLESFSIRYLFQYLFATPQTRDRFFKKENKQTLQQKLVTEVKPPKSIIRKGLKWLIIFIIKLLSREDLMLVIAKKRT